MNEIKDYIDSSDSLALCLMENAQNHRNYKIYTSMERGLQYFLTGNVYLSDGSRWNDTKDQDQMKQKNVYGTCFSYSTRENVAMWMLYGDKCGTNGAVLNLLPTSIKSILSCESVDIIKVAIGEKDEVLKSVNKDEFQLFITDVIYTTELENNKLRITYNDYNIHVSKDIVEDSRVFQKKYEWRYENECRLIVSFNKKIKEYIEEEKRKMKDSNSHIEIRLTDRNYKKMKQDRLIRSPLYKGKISFGEKSSLAGDINWKLGNY